jgi:hypothetical protein
VGLVQTNLAVIMRCTSSSSATSTGSTSKHGRQQSPTNRAGTASESIHSCTAAPRDHRISASAYLPKLLDRMPLEKYKGECCLEASHPSHQHQRSPDSDLTKNTLTSLQPHPSQNRQNASHLRPRHPQRPPGHHHRDPGSRGRASRSSCRQG